MDCPSKVRFPTRAAAQESADLINNGMPDSRTARDRRVKMFVYRCLSCGDWHLSHQRRKKLRNRKRSPKSR